MPPGLPATRSSRGCPFRGYFTFRGIDLTPTLGVPRLQSPPPAAGGVMPAASPAAGLLGLPSEPLVRGLGDELGATMVRQLVSDVGMHGVLLEVSLVLECSLVSPRRKHIRADH
jgi:hypothetical protein